MYDPHLHDRRRPCTATKTLGHRRADRTREMGCEDHSRGNRGQRRVCLARGVLDGCEKWKVDDYPMKIAWCVAFAGMTTYGMASDKSGQLLFSQGTAAFEQRHWQEAMQSF